MNRRRTRTLGITRRQMREIAKYFGKTGAEFESMWRRYLVVKRMRK